MTNPIADYHSHIRSDIFDLVPQCERLLDLGGGTGATAAELKRIGRCAFAGLIDLVAPAQDDRLDFVAQTNLDSPHAINDVTKEYGPFDVILCLDVLEHLARPEMLMPQIVAALRPGGAVIASIPNVRHISVVAPLIFRGRWDYADSGILDRTHVRFFVRDSAIALLRNAGLEIDKVQPSGFGRRSYRLLNLLTLGLFRDFFTIQYFIRARRPA